MAKDKRARPKARSVVGRGFSDYMPFTEPYQGSHLVQKRADVTIDQLVRMRQTDGQARAFVLLITLPICAALQSGTVGPSYNLEGGQDEADFIDQLFNLPPNVGG